MCEVDQNVEGQTGRGRGEVSDILLLAVYGDIASAKAGNQLYRISLQCSSQESIGSFCVAGQPISRGELS